MNTVKISYVICTGVIDKYKENLKSGPVPAELFIKNRSKLKNRLEPGSVVVICSGYQIPRNRDQYYPYRQQSDFFYLTGINQPGYVLFMCPDHPQEDLREVLLTAKQSEKEKVWHGPKPAPGELSALSGIDHVRNMDDRDQLIGQLIPGAGTVYFNLPWDSSPRSVINTFDGAMYSIITDRYPLLKPARLAPFLTELRMIKDPLEIEQIRRSCAITGSAFRKALSVIRPGIREYGVEAEIIAEFIRSGAEGHAFDPIIACGENALILHYADNNRECRDGSLLLMDFGAEVNNYAGDCTRTVPVSGRFTGRQRELYDSVHKVYRKAREMMVPGEKLHDLHQRVGTLWQEEHIRLGLYTRKQAERQDPQQPLWKRYFLHGTSHSVGLDVHDPFDRNVPLQPGMVFSCEPGLYIPEEKLGIRLENVILITDKGPEDLMEDIPMDSGEIEQLMRSMNGMKKS